MDYKKYIKYALVISNFIAIWLVSISTIDPLTKIKVLDWLMQLSFMLIVWFFAIIPTMKYSITIKKKEE